LKGAAVQEWGEAFNKGRSRMADEWVTVAGADDRKKGSVKYSVPLFAFDKSLSTKENDLADIAYNKLESSLSNRDTRKVESSDDDDFESSNEEVDF
jgi:hypothetical protein